MIYKVTSNKSVSVRREDLKSSCNVSVALLVIAVKLVFDARLAFAAVNKKPALPTVRYSL